MKIIIKKITFGMATLYQKFNQHDSHFSATTNKIVCLYVNNNNKKTKIWQLFMPLAEQLVTVATQQIDDWVVRKEKKRRKKRYKINNNLLKIGSSVTAHI